MRTNRDVEASVDFPQLGDFLKDYDDWRILVLRLFGSSDLPQEVSFLGPQTTGQGPPDFVFIDRSNSS